LSATAYEPPANFTQDRAPSDEPVAEPPRPTAPPSSAPPATTTSPAGNEVTAPPAPAAPPATTPPPTSLRKRNTNTHRTLPLDYHLSPPALIGVSSEALTLGVPAIEVRNVYSRNELALYGVNQATELRVPVLNVLF